jgi:hypothetical protein
MNERRTNQPVRQQAQQWFDALRTHLAGEAAQNDVAERLKHWATLDDVLGDCPQLLPPLLTMAWQLRHLPAFTALFQTSAGALAEDTKTALKPCGKSFDQVVLAHLQGAMRVYCVRQEEAWLAHEKTRTKPNPLTKLPLLGGLIKRLLRQRDEDLVRNYPQHGLYQMLKPWLRYPHQFALIEALATLPTSTVAILGDATRGLTSDAAIRNLAALESRKCKFVTGLARLFTETIIKAAEEARAAGRSFTLEPEPVPSNAAEITGQALCHLTVDGLHLSKGAVGVRESARDIVIKMSLAMGYDMWRVFATQDSALNVAHCPAPLARALGGNTVHVHRKTSEALNALPDQHLIEGIVVGLYNGAGADALARWAANPACASGWQRIATEIKQTITQRGQGAVTAEGASSFAQSLIPTFGALSGEAPPPGADAPGAAPAAEAAPAAAPAAS